MNKNEKSSAGMGVPVEDANESFAVDNYTANNKGLQGKIASILPHGEENAIKAADLLELAGLDNTRQLRNAIAAERERGALILSTCRRPFGYYLPDEGAKGRAEISACVRTIEKRAKNSLRILRTARRALREIDGQEEMSDE